MSDGEGYDEVLKRLIQSNQRMLQTLAETRTRHRPRTHGPTPGPVTTGMGVTTADEAFERWLETGEISPMAVRTVADDLDEFLSGRLAWVEESLRDDRPHEAFARLRSLTGFLSIITERIPGVELSLSDHAQKLRDKVEEAADKLGADEFHIYANVPTGVSLGLTFHVS